MTYDSRFDDALERFEARMNAHEEADRLAFKAMGDMIGGFEAGEGSLSKQLRSISQSQRDAATERKTMRWLLGILVACLVTLSMDRVAAWLHGERTAAAAAPAPKDAR